MHERNTPDRNLLQVALLLLEESSRLCRHHVRWQRQRSRVDAILQERFFVNIERYGNTSSASLLIAAAEWWESIGRQASGPVALAAFGAGLNWGAMLLQPE